MVARAGTGARRSDWTIAVGRLFVQLFQCESRKCAEFSGAGRRGADGHRMLSGANVAVPVWGGASSGDGVRGARSEFQDGPADFGDFGISGGTVHFHSVNAADLLPADAISGNGRAD